MMCRQPIAVLVAIPKMFLRINLDLDSYLANLIAKANRRLLILKYILADLKLWR